MVYESVTLGNYLAVATSAHTFIGCIGFILFTSLFVK